MSKLTTRFDVSPKRSKHQQTYRHVLPQFSLWADGYQYRQVGISIGWWKWTLHIFLGLPAPPENEDG